MAPTLSNEEKMKLRMQEMKEVADILSGLSRQGLIDYLVHSLNMGFKSQWLEMSMTSLVELALLKDYGEQMLQQYQQWKADQ